MKNFHMSALRKFFSHSLVKSGSIVFLGILAGRILGFCREIYIAHEFGVSQKTDIITLILTTPDILTNILIGGAFSSILIPEFSKNTTSAYSLMMKMSALVFAALLVLITLIHLNLNLFVQLIAPGFSKQAFDYTLSVIPLSLIAIPFSGLAGVTTAYLQAKEKFLAPSLGTLIINSAILLSIYITTRFNLNISTIAAGIALGGILRWIAQIWPSMSIENKSGNHSRKAKLNIKLLKKYTQALGASSILILFPFAARMLASYDETGSLSIVNYSLKLVDFPLGLCVSIFAVILFPRLSNAYSSNNPAHFNQSIKLGLTCITVLSLIITTGIYFLAYPLVSLFFGHGKMSYSDLTQLTNLLKIGIFSLIFQGLLSFINVIFNSMHDTKTPLLINALGLAFFIITGFTLQNILLAQTIMLLLVISFAIITIIQLIALNKKHQINILKLYRLKKC